MDPRKAMDDEAALRHYTFNVGDFSRDLAAVTVRVVRRDLERLLAEQPKRDVERLWLGALRREYAGEAVSKYYRKNSNRAGSATNRTFRRQAGGNFRQEYAGVLDYTCARGLEGHAPTPASGAGGAADKRHRAKLPQRFQPYFVMRAK
jgi:hypothetical protein